MTTTRNLRPRRITATVTGTYLTRDHIINGTAEQLAAVLANHRSAGTLIAATGPGYLQDGSQVIAIRIREYQPGHPTQQVTSAGQHARTRIQRPHRLAVIVTAITGTAAGLLAAAAYLLGQLVELIAAHAGLVLTVLVLAALALAAAARRRSSKGRHCPGC
jgi:hypothetical protein